MPKALVTGASGFIGSTLIEELSSRGYEVYALLRKTSDTSNLKDATYQRVDGDLSNLDSLKKAVQGMDYVFHLAGVVTGPTRDYFFEHNAGGTKRLAQAVSEFSPNLKRFVHVSSLAASGPSLALDQPKTEAHAESPVSSYGESKLQGERELLRYKDQFPIAIIRPPMVYGPKDRGVFVVIQTVSKKLMPLIQGATTDGSKYYSLIHVRDLCRGIIQAAEVPQEKIASGETFFLTDGGIYSYRELLLAMASALGVKPWEFRIPQIAVTVAAGAATALGMMTRKTFPLNWDKLNEIRPDFWICSNQKAKDVLGYCPQHDLSSGMNDAIEWYKAQNWL